MPLLLRPCSCRDSGRAALPVLTLPSSSLSHHEEWCICVGEKREVVPIPQPASVMTVQAAELRNWMFTSANNRNAWSDMLAPFGASIRKKVMVTALSSARASSVLPVA